MIVNRRAGRSGGLLAERGRDTLGVAGAGAGSPPGFRVIETEPGDLAARIRDMVEEGVGLLAVAGGDGTMRTAAEILAGSRTTLIPVPAGTLNHFARRCGIARWSDVGALMTAGRTVTGAVGVADDRMFLNTLITGSYPDVVVRRDRYERILPRWLAAPFAFVATVLRARPVRVVLETEEGRWERRTMMVWIGLGRGSFPLSHRSAPVGERDILEVAVVRETGRLGTLRVGLRLIRRAMGGGDDPGADPGVDLERVQRIVIHSHGTIRATLDGEPLRFRSPLFVGVQQGALRLRVRDGAGGE